MSWQAPKPKSHAELEKERAALEAQAEADFEMELFQKYDMPIFLEDVADQSDFLTGDDCLKVLDWLFFNGWDSKHTCFIKGEFRGKVPVEIANKMDDMIKIGAETPERICKGFEDVWRKHKLDEVEDGDE
jgi:hypothetical protein